MSKETLPQPSNNEEVDLGILFNAIGKLFDRFINFLLAIFNFIVSLIVNFSRAIIDNYKLIAGALIISGIIGYGLEKILPPRYDSTMLVRTYFDAKYQLNTNLNYYNAILDEENIHVLANIFEVDEATIQEIKEFELSPGPESENEKLVQYDNFINSIDSIRGQDISFDDYLENKDIFTGNIFEIRIETTKNDIFKDLEKGINKSFNNLYSTEIKKKRDSMLGIRKENILNSIKEIDSLQNVYINVLNEESQSTRAKISLGEGFPLQQEKSNTKEYQLLDKELTLRNELRLLEEKKIKDSEFYEVISQFQEVGNRVKDLKRRYSLALPIVTLIFLFLGYLIKNYVSFVNKYEV